MQSGLRTAPKGSRVYAYDQYVIQEGAQFYHFSAGSHVACDARGFRITDPLSGRSLSFPSSSTVEVERAWKWIVLKPGEKATWPLTRDLKLGVAYYLKTI
jgi:hypothetical protein